MSDNETLADIVAELRADANAVMDDLLNDDCWTNVEAGEIYASLANRIEAAAVRDIRAERAPGNAAAMREAMTSVAENLALHVQCGRFVAPGDHVSFPASEAEAYIRDIRAALSAPPRNCDRFSSYAEAENYWHENVECAEVNGCFDVWLFAPAEGGAE